MLTKILYDHFQGYNLAQNSKIKKRVYEKLLNKESAFEWLHAGTLSMPIGELFALINKHALKIPRTGHLGNWQEIFAGKAGALDHNGTVCSNGLGFPYIYDANQTENDDFSSGDTVYLVGSIVNGLQRVLLDIYTWNAETFVQRNRNNSYFTPFAFTHSKDGLRSLCVIHKESCLLYEEAQFFSDVILNHQEIVKHVVRLLLEEIISNQEADIGFNDLFDRTVSLDGKMVRANIQYKQGCIVVGSTFFKDVDQFLDAIFIPMRAAQDPDWFLKNVHTLPENMPFMSLALLSYLDCLFRQSEDAQSPISTYLEWGAFGSAAYPPRFRGYFKEKVRVIKKIANIMSRKDESIKSIFYVLLPASIFNLLPNSAYPEDAVLVEKLFEDVLKEPMLKTQTDQGGLMEIIERIVFQWWSNNEDKLSNYYKARFRDRRTVFHKMAAYESAKPIFLSQFYHLTLQQACMIVGGLFQVAQIERGDL